MEEDLILKMPFMSVGSATPAYAPFQIFGKNISLSLLQNS